MAIHVTPIPRLTNFGAPSYTLGTSNAAGDSNTAVASNSTLLTFDGSVPANIAASSATGSATVTARRDHVHGGLSASTALIASGTYTGDGAATLAIDTLGFQPKFLRIDRRYTTAQTGGQSKGANVQGYASLVDDNAAGMAITGNDGTNEFWTYTLDCIVSLDAGGFTVGDAGTSNHPNNDTTQYNYVAIG